MSLPKIEVPVYNAVLPSTGKSVEFRPFLVREQKQLLIALNGGLEDQITAVNELVRACTYGKVEAETSPAYDVEYLFLQIRAKSVGESIDIVLNCQHCENKQDAKLDITNVGVNRPEGHKTDIDLGNGLLISMRDPDLRELGQLREELTADSIIQLIARSIKNIWNNNEMYDVKDYSTADLIEFVEGLSPGHLEKINEFFETLPVLRHELDFTCTKCNAENHAVLEGLQSFFV